MAKGMPGLSDVFQPLLVGEAVRTLGLSRPDAESRYAQAVRPSAPSPDLTGEQLAGERPGDGAQAPGFLGLSPQMTGLQQRTAIATGGTSGDDPKYKDPATVEYYRNLALTDLVGPSGDILGQPTGVERQYAQRLGYDERGGSTTESFLSSLLRG